jgi:S1-C subfamily serine protease
MRTFPVRIVSGVGIMLLGMMISVPGKVYSQALRDLGPRALCFSALETQSNSSQPPRWHTVYPQSQYADEARRRGYSPEYCTIVMGGEVLPQPPNKPAATAQTPATPDPLIVSIQTLLGALGYDAGLADGFAGSKTAAAISAFQQSLGEKPDGRASEGLRARLQKALAERGPGSAPKQSDKPRDGSKRDTKLVSTGTGFFISSDIIITNNHVVEGCKEIRVAKRGAEIGGARSIATNRGDDLAALRADKPSENYLKLRIGVPVKAAEPVLVFGYPLSVVLSSSGNTTLGNVTALAGLKDDSRYIQIST